MFILDMLTSGEVLVNMILGGGGSLGGDGTATARVCRTIGGNDGGHHTRESDDAIRVIIIIIIIRVSHFLTGLDPFSLSFISS